MDITSPDTPLNDLNYSFPPFPTLTQTTNSIPTLDELLGEFDEIDENTFYTMLSAVVETTMHTTTTTTNNIYQETDPMDPPEPTHTNHTNHTDSSTPYELPPIPSSHTLHPTQDHDHDHDHTPPVYYSSEYRTTINTLNEIYFHIPSMNTTDSTEYAVYMSNIFELKPHIHKTIHTLIYNKPSTYIWLNIHHIRQTDNNSTPFGLHEFTPSIASYMLEMYYSHALKRTTYSNGDTSIWIRLPLKTNRMMLSFLEHFGDKDDNAIVLLEEDEDVNESLIKSFTHDMMDALDQTPIGTFIRKEWLELE